MSSALECRPACNNYGDTEEPSTSGRTAELQVPLKLRLTGSPNGKPDLQLQLFTINLGEAADQSSGRTGRRRHSPHLSGKDPRLHHLLRFACLAASVESRRQQDYRQLGQTIIASLSV